ncbi:MAG: pyrroline-5-carboxylate reductase, partial [Treponema sp.]|nr:pyrroline-5-carboxylate reductase [Treponema sp.]
MAVSIACIGSGNMGFALMKGAAGLVGGGNIGFTDADRSKAESSAKALGAAVYASNTEAVERADLVFLAVKPQVLSGVLEEIAPAVRKRLALPPLMPRTEAPAAPPVPSGGKPLVLVSMAAGWSLGKIRALLGGSPAVGPGPGTSPAAGQTAPLIPIPLVRIMPNTPALISQGMIALTASPEVPQEQLAEVEKILSAAGTVDRVEEKYLDAVTGLSGSGPAFVYLFIEALADGGVRAGLPRDKALRYAAQTVLG